MLPNTVDPDDRSRQGRRALIGAWVGQWVDLFDVYLPIIVLAPAAAYFEPTGVSDTTKQIVTALIFAATLLGRPIGAAIFGHLSDRTGRRRTTIISVVGFGTATLLIAFLPGYHTVGIPAIVILVLLRFIDGIFLGGQYTAATPLALEYSPKARRGLHGAIITSGFPLAYCTTALITFGLLKLIPSNGLNSPYVQWGWRIPFIIGAVIAFLFAAWYRRSVQDSATWQEAPKSATPPLLELFRGENLRTFGQIFTLMTGIWLSFNVVGAILPGELKRSAHLSNVQVTVLLIVAYAILAAAYIGAGLFGQRFGRRRFFLISGFLTAIVSPLIYAAIVANALPGTLTTALLTIVLVVIVISIYGVVTTYIIERFHTGVRSSAYGLGYSAAVIIPAFYVFYQTGLSQLMPMKYTPVVLLALGGVLIVLGAAVGPETRDVDLATHALGPESEPSPRTDPIIAESY